MARSGFEVQKVTVEALFLREIRTRFGKFRLGYLWAILEPSAHLLILLGILVTLCTARCQTSHSRCFYLMA